MAVPAALSSWRSLALLAAVLIGGGATFIYSRDKPTEDARRADAARFMNDLMSDKAQVGGPFTLEDQYGKRRSLADFGGKPVLLYFGYTFCPDVCPTDLAAMAQAIRTLDAAGKVLQPIFITLDPERDTREILRNSITWRSCSCLTATAGTSPSFRPARPPSAWRSWSARC